MTLDSGFSLENLEMTYDLSAYTFEDNSELISPTSKEPTVYSPESVTGGELDWHFNEQFQELSAITEVPPRSGGVAMTHSNLPSTSEYRDDGGILANGSEEDISNMLNVAFIALDESFPDGVMNYLNPAPEAIVPKTSATDETDDTFTDLVPTTITEACDQTEKDTRHEDENNPPANSIQKSKKRPASTKVPSNSKQRKLSVESSSLVVELKPNESQQQAVRRVKNNYASRVFRSKRKTKLEVMMTKEEELTRLNDGLRHDLQSVTELVSLLKEGLINKCNSRNTQ